MVSYEVRRGATARFLLKDTSGESLDGWTCEGVLRRLAPGAARLAGNEPVAAEYEIDNLVGEQGKGWILTIPAEATANLAPGAYLSDARITLPGDDVAITEGWTVHVIEPATLA